ncbi:hypothetical protein K2173_020888 [Erythroxylum novogranatense]|uniref:BHLH domain-containing protein n=1 Tax=Erythroxylum novogranatense TaxID=1862640 RepID=A0AAV8TP24_9ROSI|nr:hypothetical protein K2173_020888 [Erythroxylum novogranatense]
MRDMQQPMNSLLSPSSSSSSLQVQDLQLQQQIHGSHFDASSSSNDDFLEQMLSTIPSCSWAGLKSPWELNPTSNLTMPVNSGKSRDETASENNFGFHNLDESAILASKLRQQQISGGNSVVAAANLMLQQQLMMPPSEGGEGSLYNGFGAGSIHVTGQGSNQTQQHFHHPQAQNTVTTSRPVTNQQSQVSGSTGGGHPKPRVRARRGQATDPHSIAERLRRERIAERMKALQELVPNANKTDKASMLDEIVDYVKFLQLQVKVLSMSRLGGGAAVTPLVADISSEGDCLQVTANGGAFGRTSNGSDTIKVTEHQVAKLMEEDMGSAMQYLQGKGLCLMPISLATAISTASFHNRNPVNVIGNSNNSHSYNPHPLLRSNINGPSSPTVSALTVQSATFGNGVGDGSVKETASVSKP